MDADKPSLGALARACLGNFGRLSTALGQTIEEYYEPMSNLEWEFGRFKIWCGNLGALQSGSSSLDSRLRESTVMRTNVSEHLASLNQTLINSIQVVTGARLPLEKQPKLQDSSSESSSEDSTDDDEPPSELALHMITIKEILTDLYKLSFRIRSSISRLANPRPKLYSEIDTETGVDKFGAFAEFDRRHIEDSLRQIRREVALKMGKNDSEFAQVTDGDEYLINRLIAGMRIRRRTLKYWQRHAKKLAVTPKEIQEVMRAQPIPKPHAVTSESKSVVKGLKPDQPNQSMSQSSVTGKTLLSETEATRFDKQLDDLQETRSVISYASTAVDNNEIGIELPGPPATAFQGSEFVCPYCAVVCPARYGKNRAWRAHLLHDLQPYICTFEACDDDEKLFSSSTAWLEHERLGHRRVWLCFEHASPEFSSKGALRDHLHEKHDNDITREQIEHLVDVSESSIAESRTRCPFCLQEAPFDKGFADHVALHMQKFAAYSISRGILTQDESDTDENGSESARVLGFGSERSLMEGHLQFDSHPPSEAPSSIDAEVSRSLTSPVSGTRSTTDDENLPSTAALAQTSEISPEMMEWLSPTDFSGIRHAYMSDKVTGTGLWFLSSTKFQNWLTGPDKVLFCPGMPGAGKTFMAALIIDYINGTIADDTTGVASVFFNRRSPLLQSFSFCVAAILRQLVQCKPSAAARVIDLFHRKPSAGASRSASELSLLDAYCTEFSVVYIVIDALDECDDDERTRFRLISELLSLKNSHNVRLLVTSRYLPYETRMLRSVPKLEVRASAEDIRGFIQHKKDGIFPLLPYNEELMEEIYRKVINFADGM